MTAARKARPKETRRYCPRRNRTRFIPAYSSRAGPCVRRRQPRPRASGRMGRRARLERVPNQRGGPTLLPIKRIDHVAIAAESIDERVRFLSELFGMKPGARYDNPQDGYNGVELSIPGSDTKWEVIEPAGENSFVTRFLGQRGPGLHHVTFEVKI